MASSPRVAALAAAALLALTGTTTEAAVETRRVVDRTFGCIPQALTGKLRATDVTAVPRGSVEGRDPFAPPSPGFVGVSSGGWEAASELVSVRARSWRRFGSATSRAGVFASRACRPSRAAVDLSAGSLAGRPTRWTKRVTCIGRGRVIIRVRAVLAAGVPWRPLVTKALDGAPGTVVSAALAVRSEQTGRLLAYVELAQDGTTRHWVGSGCAR